MYRVIAGGTGLIGKRLVREWLKQKHTITVVGRSRDHIQKVFGDRVQPITWDQLTADTLKSAELVVNLTGENFGAGRWTPKRKQEIIDSRVNSTRKIANLLGEI